MEVVSFMESKPRSLGVKLAFSEAWFIYLEGR